MPWQETNPMDERVLFISDYLRESIPFSRLCERYNISRKTGYKWVQRYKALGLEGLSEQSRRPNSHPSQLPLTVRKSIIELRTSPTITPGAKKIQTKLKEQFPDMKPPSLTTIYNVLHAEGAVKKRRKRRRVEPYSKKLTRSQQANDLWSVDFKGQFKLGNGKWCYPLTVMDDYSRLLIACDCQKSVKTTETKRNFEKIFREYGLPQRIRSDNGVPFASKATAGLSRLSIWWIRLGILPERIEPGKPQQNGKHERMHRTLKSSTLQPVSSSFTEQQRRFDTFKQEYNNERPHESLDQQVPAKHYQPSSREYPEKLPALEYPSYFDVRKVKNPGIVYWRNGQVYISHLLIGENIGICEIDDGVFNVYLGFYKIGSFNIRDERKGACSYWSLKV